MKIAFRKQLSLADHSSTILCRYFDPVEDTERDLVRAQDLVRDQATWQKRNGEQVGVFRSRIHKWQFVHFLNPQKPLALAKRVQ